jgi:hypothetical protein
MRRPSGRREDRIWVAFDTHQVPYRGRGKLKQFQKGWSSSHSLRLCGYWIPLAIDTDAGVIITFPLVRSKIRLDGSLPC